MTVSLAASLASQPPQIQAEILASLNNDELAALEYDWRFWARPEQLAPQGEWSTWLALAGRGWGKTEAGANWVKEREKAGARSIALVAETQKDLEEVMVPRLLSIYPPDEAPSARFRPVRVTWPSGAVAFGYNGTEPDQLRGPEFDTAWVDELAKYRRSRETWDMLQFTMRSGTDPRVLVTTTPRPIPVLKEIIADESTVISRGSTYDNAANLAPAFLEQIKRKYEGTRLGRQELSAEVLDDLPGALWTHSQFDEGRVTIDDVPDMVRIVVAVDPSGSAGDDDGDSQGIVVAGKGVDGIGYVFADMTCKLSPAGWGRRAVDAYRGSWSKTPEKHRADRIVAEKNFGGRMVEDTIRTVDHTVSYKAVNASHGKVVRAEPVAALYEQKRVRHVGSFPEMEDQMCGFGPDGYIGEGSPDRADALVWALTELMLDGSTYSLLDNL